LELEELFNPQKLYTYLRNHHWKDGIAEEFLQEWVQMRISKYTLSENDLNDFQVIFQKLKLPIGIITNLFGKTIVKDQRGDKSNLPKETIELPSIHDFSKFKKWMLERIKDIEELLN